LTFADHEEAHEAGDAFYVSGARLQHADVGTEYLQFSPAEELEVVSETTMRNLRALQGPDRLLRTNSRSEARGYLSDWMYATSAAVSDAETDPGLIVEAITPLLKPLTTCALGSSMDFVR
jgi:hypothetical protein